MPFGFSCTSRFEGASQRVSFSVFLGAAVLTVLGSHAAAQDCKDEIRRIQSDLEAMGESEPGYAMLSRQVSRATDYCLAGQQGLYESFISPPRAFFESSDEPGEELESSSSFADLTGRWCYEHESGERANYEFFEDGKYRAALAEMDWQWVIEGKAEEALPRASIVSADDDRVQVRVGAHNARMTPGFCAGSRP